MAAVDLTYKSLNLLSEWPLNLINKLISFVILVLKFFLFFKYHRKSLIS